MAKAIAFKQCGKDEQAADHESLGDWQWAVASGDTRLGFWEWLNKTEEEEGRNG
jgi:hypothetical protein